MCVTTIIADVIVARLAGEMIAECAGDRVRATAKKSLIGWVAALRLVGLAVQALPLPAAYALKPRVVSSSVARVKAHAGAFQFFSRASSRSVSSVACWMFRFPRRPPALLEPAGRICLEFQLPGGAAVAIAAHVEDFIRDRVAGNLVRPVAGAEARGRLPALTWALVAVVGDHAGVGLDGPFADLAVKELFHRFLYTTRRRIRQGVVQNTIIPVNNSVLTSV